ncbi:MAG: PilN domain-containing protein [Methylacidiphilales bacterium]|nr:PilN domain-containing protein [Candidatus Methylacidiphilales bacterium]MDW8350027.1 hypothetical protein [Verrucomicrobiae bacterium]
MAAQKTKKHNLDHLVLLPGEEMWELWHFQSPVPSFIEAHNDIHTLAPRAQVLALPSRYVFSIPIWLTTTDDTLIKDLLTVQLEKRGFRNRPNHELIWQYQIVDKRESQTLILAYVLPTHLPAPFTSYTDITYYPPLASLYTLAPSSMTLWKELGRWCVAVSPQGNLGYFQDLGETHLTPQAVTQLLMLRHQLYAEDILPDLQLIQIYGLAQQDELDALGLSFDASIQMLPRPAPLWHPNQSISLTPQPIRIALQQRAKRRQTLFYLQVAAVLYLIFLSVTTIYYAIISIRSHHYKAIQKTKDPIVKKIQSTAQKWRALEPAISPDYYPFELLWRASKALPEDGVRWTLFELQDKKIVITGEAKNAPAASKYLDDLKQSPELRDFTWTMPPPRLLPNDSAQFQIEGLRHASP